MDSDAERICKSCHGCQVVGQLNIPEPMKRTEPPSGLWQDVAVDLMGPMPTGESLLVVVDYYSCYYEVVIMHSTTTEKIVDALSSIFGRFGFPHSLKSDNGPQFLSKDFQTFLQESGIEHRTSPPLWPQANSEVERQNRTLLKALKVHVAQVEGKNWRKELPKFLLAYRSTPQLSTGSTPASLMFGRELKTKLPKLRGERSVLDESSRERDWQHKLEHKEYADSKRGSTNSSLAPGDKVLLRNTKAPGKLTPNFESTPYTVLTKEGHEVMMESEDGVASRRDSSFVKPYHPPTDGTPTADIALGNQEVETRKEETWDARPSRTIRLPERFKDFVMDKPK